MRKLFLLSLVIIISIMLIFSCSNDKKTNPYTESPNPPYNPNPSDYETLVEINIVLSWECTDPEVELLTFDVYFGESNNPSLVSLGQSGTTYNPGILNEDTTYYWIVEVHDEHYNSTIGDIWQFTIKSGLGTITDIDGNVYQTLIIGNQEWMVENLKVTHYKNGDSIPHLISNEDWTSTSNGAYCVYDHNSSNVDTYGKLYNWYVVGDPRGIAPNGWHVPTDEEWMELEMFLGMSYIDANSWGYRGTNVGSSLAGNANLWDDGELEISIAFSNSGFNALPGGYRYFSLGTYYAMNENGRFWSSTDSANYYAMIRYIRYISTTISRYNTHKRDGLSIRCVKD